MKTHSIGILLILIAIVAGLAVHRHNVGANADHDRGDRIRGEDVEVSTEAFHITAADGVKSIAQLIREQSTGSPTPAQSISSVHFIVDADGGDLTLARVEGGQPPGFQLTINAGQDKRFRVTRVPLKGIEALEFFPVKTESRTPCNFLLILEFYPKR